MIREVKFESQERRINQIIAALNKHGIKDIEEANQICDSYGLDPYMTCQETQGICFENAKWAYVVGSAIALKEGRASPPPRVPSKLPKWPTRCARTPCAAS